MRIFVKNYKMVKRKNHPNRQNYIWKDDKLVLKDECFECGSFENIHYHHIVPSTMGGTKTIPLCIICHGKVHDRDFVKHKELQKIGIKRAKENGVFMGRAKGSYETPEEFLNKSKSKKIIELLQKGYLYSEISNIVLCSTGTIVKVNKLMDGIRGPYETREEFLNKSNSKKIIELLEKGYLYSEISSIVPCSTWMIAKVNKLMDGIRGPYETETPEKFLNKSKSKKIIELLDKGCSVREISSIVPCSIHTIAKVNKLIN